jgi:hypothetical protein
MTSPEGLSKFPPWRIAWRRLFKIIGDGRSIYRYAEIHQRYKAMPAIVQLNERRHCPHNYHTNQLWQVICISIGSHSWGTTVFVPILLVAPTQYGTPCMQQWVVSQIRKNWSPKTNFNLKLDYYVTFENSRKQDEKDPSKEHKPLFSIYSRRKPWFVLKGKRSKQRRCRPQKRKESTNPSFTSSFLC